MFISDPGSGFLPIPDPKTAINKREEKTYSGSRNQGSKRHRIPGPGSATLIKILFSPEVIQAASCLDENLRGECETQFPALLP
jgi:hypothetical protein